MSVVVYTAVFAKRDHLRDPQEVIPGWQYLCFSDGDLDTKVWKIIKVDSPVVARREARRVKLLPHIVLPPHEFSIWQDASMQICGNLKELIIEVNDVNAAISLYPHGQKLNLFQILENCKRHKWDSSKVLDALRDRYKTEQYPPDFPTFETGVIIRRNTEICNQLNDMWWDELSRGSLRDQASFSYVVWRLGVKVHPLRGSVSKNGYFEFHPHSVSNPFYSDFRTDKAVKLL